MDNNLQDMIAKAVVDIIKQKEDNKGIKVGRVGKTRSFITGTFGNSFW